MGTISGREMKGDVSQVRKGETRFLKKNHRANLRTNKNIFKQLDELVLSEGKTA